MVLSYSPTLVLGHYFNFTDLLPDISKSIDNALINNVKEQILSLWDLLGEERTSSVLRRRFPGKENDKIIVPSYSAQDATNGSCCLDETLWLLCWILTNREYVLFPCHFSLPIYFPPFLNLKSLNGLHREGVANPSSHKEVQTGT